MRLNRVSGFAIGLGILAIGITGFILLNRTKPTATVQDVTEMAWRVAVQVVSPDRINPVFNGFGTVENPDTQLIKSRLAADVISVLRREGARVSKGDTLLALSTVEAELKLNQARASLADAKASLAALNATEIKDREALVLERQTLNLKRQNLDRITELRAQTLASQQTLDEITQAVATQALQVNRRELALATVDSRRLQLNAAIARAESEVRAADQDLASTRIQAPADGQVEAILVTPGERVNSNQNLLRFAPDVGREIRVQVPADIGNRLADALDRGIPVTAQTNANTALTLSRVAARVQDRTGALDVFFASTERLPPIGSVVPIELALEAVDDVIVLPTDAVYGGNTVYRISNDSRLEAITVERLGRRPGAEQTDVLIRSPSLQSGDRILVSRLPAAVTGLAVEVIE